MNESASIKNSTAVVTGANGFIGSHLVDHLVGLGCRVNALVRKTSDLKWLRPSPQVRLHTADLTQPSSLNDCLREAEYVFHCAGLTRAKTRGEFFKVNADACEPFYKACADHGKRIKAVVHLSSLAAVGPGTYEKPIDETSPCRPLTHYGKSKLAGEEIARSYSSSLPIIIIRPPVVYGPREKNFFDYLKTVGKGWDVRIGKARKELSLIYCLDLARAMAESALRPDREDNIYFVTDGDIHSWEDVAGTVAKILNVRPRTIIIPEKFLFFTACLMEGLAWLSPKPALIDRQRTLDICQSSWTASPKKFFNDYNFKPQYDLQRGLSETLAWSREQGWL